jgi:hypothetical protein
LPRRAIAAFLVTLAVGVAFVVWRAASNDLDVAFTNGPGPTPIAAVILPHAEICQTPIEVLADTGGVTFWVRGQRPGTPFDVTVRDLAGRPLRRDRVVAGAGAPALQTARFAPVRRGTTIALCIRNGGRRLVYPSGGEQEPDSGTVEGRHRSGADLALVFAREHPRSALSLVPTIFRRAALFRFGWLGAWAYWAIAALVLLAVPALCALALRRAAGPPTAGIESRRPPAE